MYTLSNVYSKQRLLFCSLMWTRLLLLNTFWRSHTDTHASGMWGKREPRHRVQEQDSSKSSSWPLVATFLFAGKMWQTSLPPDFCSNQRTLYTETTPQVHGSLPRQRYHHKHSVLFFFFFSFFTDSKDQTLHTGRIGHSPEDACNVAPLKVKQRALDRKDYH